jgi:hypothetical protein
MAQMNPLYQQFPNNQTPDDKEADRQPPDG